MAVGCGGGGGGGGGGRWGGLLEGGLGGAGRRFGHASRSLHLQRACPPRAEACPPPSSPSLRLIPPPHPPHLPPTPRPALACMHAGGLDKGEVQQALGMAGFKLEPPAFEALFASFDPDRRGAAEDGGPRLAAAAGGSFALPACLQGWGGGVGHRRVAGVGALWGGPCCRAADSTPPLITAPPLPPPHPTPPPSKAGVKTCAKQSLWQ